MRLLHTADWHLGHHLHGHDRSYEHQCFLDWLADQIVERHIDVLLIAGDIFDSANPSAASWQQFYRFLARMKVDAPHLNIVAIGGNHDSPSKLDAPHELLRAFELHLVGSIRRDANGELDLERLCVPLRDADGQTQAWCAAVPFLRSADLRLDGALAEDEDRLVEGVRQIYAQVLAELQIRRRDDQPIIAMGHAYLISGQLSALSERRVLGGNQHALPSELFAGADYVALGHLHLAQSLGKNIRYSGSPLPLSLAEQHYPHQVVEIELGSGGVAAVTALPVPRSVPIMRLPEQAAPLEEVESCLSALTLPACLPEARPFLEVRVLMDKPLPRLRERILDCLADKPVRLARISCHYIGQGDAAADRLANTNLDELTPERVFELCYARHFEGEPGDPLRQAFHELHEQVRGEHP